MERKYCIAKNICLKPYNTMGIEAWSEIFCVPFSINDIITILDDYNDNAIIIGSGSNTIFQEKKYTIPIISTIGMNKIEYNNCKIIVDSGVTLSRLAWFALEHHITGFEYLEDIPGSVGGALFMNAGTYEESISDKVESIIIFDYEDKQVKELTQEQLLPNWGRRQSYFQHHPCFIIKAVLEANSTGDYEGILDKMLDIKKKRYLKQPREYPSAGSVFKRPYVNGEPRYIWKLFDEAGLRGFRIGDAQVSEKHPGFIVNVGNATGKDIVDLMNHCKQVVFDKYGIRIEEEWKIV